MMLVDILRNNIIIVTTYNQIICLLDMTYVEDLY